MEGWAARPPLVANGAVRALCPLKEEGHAMKTLAPTMWMLLLSLACWTPPALGAPPGVTGPALSAEQQRLVDELLASQHPYHCCRDTIAACLQQPNPCPLAIRLERAIRGMAAAGKSRAEIEEALATREQSMSTSRPVVTIGSDPRFEAGLPAAPVVLSIYASGLNTDCAQLIPALHVEVCSGRLKGKARLNFRPFISGTDETGESCGRAMIAAADQGLFWPYLLHLYGKQESFEACMIKKWAYTGGVDRGAFDMAYDSPMAASLLATVRREGLENGVESVPTAFINGRRIRCGFSVDTLVDLLGEEYERVTARGAAATQPGRRN